MGRPIKAIALPQLELHPIVPAELEFRRVAPSSLKVEDRYQRQLSKESIGLIRKIAASWDWSRFKPPVCAETPDGLYIIDGQHTAIAAACRPEIAEIPVMVIQAAELEDQARSFVGHNKDRLVLSQAAIHYASVAGGDEDALTVQQVCDRAGATILRTSPGVTFKVGETLAVVTIRALVNRRGAMNARITLQALVEGHCAPLEAAQIMAVETLLFAPEFRGEHKPADLSSTLMRIGASALRREAKVFAASHSVPLWRGMVVVLGREAKRGRRRAA